MPLNEILAASWILASMTVSFGAAFGLMFLKRLEVQQKRRLTIEILPQIRDRLVLGPAAQKALDYGDLENVLDPEIGNPNIRHALIYSMDGAQFLSILIRRRAIDEDLAREFLKEPLTALFRNIQLLISIERDRTSNKDLYSDFEYLARRWIGNERL